MIVGSVHENIGGLYIHQMNILRLKYDGNPLIRKISCGTINSISYMLKSSTLQHTKVEASSSSMIFHAIIAVFDALESLSS